MRRPPGLAVALALRRDREAFFGGDVQRQVRVVQGPSGEITVGLVARSALGRWETCAGMGCGEA